MQIRSMLAEQMQAAIDVHRGALCSSSATDKHISAFRLSTLVMDNQEFIVAAIELADLGRAMAAVPRRVQHGR